MTHSWRCVLIGAESLLIQCARNLLEAGHCVLAIVTRAEPVRRWASEEGIRVLRSVDDLLTSDDLGGFDYLFSITHLEVLPSAIIRLPQSAAINFHDALLPDYAGLNAPVWALLNGETEHGITWHLMTEKVDRGAILLQQRFLISPEETALSLNAKCFEAGVESFARLIQGLAQGCLIPRPQMQPSLYFYARADRPEAAGTIDWKHNALPISALVRALDFGSYGNPVGCAKAFIAGRLWVLSKVNIQSTGSDAAPGTILSLGQEGMMVATADQDLCFAEVQALDGKPLTDWMMAADEGLRVGSVFDTLAPGLRDRLSTLNSKVARFEPYWQEALAQLEHLELPLIRRYQKSSPPVYQFLDLSLKKRGLWGAWPIEGWLALSVCYLGRLCDKDVLDIGFSDPALRAMVHGMEPWFAAQVPWRCPIDYSQDASTLIADISSRLKDLRSHWTYSSDLMLRTPLLRSGAGPGGVIVLPVALVVVNEIENARAVQGSELTLAIDEKSETLRWIYDETKLLPDTVLAMQSQWVAMVSNALSDPGMQAGHWTLLPPLEYRSIVENRHQGQQFAGRQACVHHLISEQVARTPGQTALVCRGQSLSYLELDQKANQLARQLVSLGVGPDILVGIFMDRSLDMVLSVLAIHKAGGAYVPLDPRYPRDRLEYMMQDAQLTVILTHSQCLQQLPSSTACTMVSLDTDWPGIAQEPDEAFDGGAQPHHLAYVIYTSGSTGKPKGVMVEHRNVVNFFAGMDQHLGQDEPGVWLAVTSLSFDISVLELCWTLTRGYQVIVATHEEQLSAASSLAGGVGQRPIEFSLFYFSSDESVGAKNKYQLLLEGAKFADQHGFAAVWTPERHFHAFGGAYPNPAVTSAALAAVTQRIQIRAGSVVLPLHHPIRVAEDWAVVDNLSGGRVGVSFASGWQPDDFVFKPENFARNKDVLEDGLDVVRRLWRGERLSFPGGAGPMVEIGILPRPVQAELPVWITTAGNPETFALAGRLGVKVLTHLLGQSIDELAAKLVIYRQAWTQAGHAGEGHVSLMLHTLVGQEEADVRAKVRQPLINYLRSSVQLIQQYAWSFPAFRRKAGMETSASGMDLKSLSEEDLSGLLAHAFERYYESSGLFGTPHSCLAMVQKLNAIGVHEIACLIDFGVDPQTVLAHLQHLNTLRLVAAPPQVTQNNHSVPALMTRYGVTHFQCTPSMARMLLLDEHAQEGLRQLKRWMIGGEALPLALAHELHARVGASVMNMYGPTETTVWSAVQPMDPSEKTVSLGQPLLNQSIDLLDSRLQPVPWGAPGEVVIGGAGVVRGYWQRPELTAERFMVDPLRGAQGGRVYRTGDLARFRPDGSLEFLGRLDHQIKLRGFRIELGEIEACLFRHPRVREAVVMAREDTPGDARLIAYWVPSGRLDANESELKEMLKEHLPEFMVPSAFVRLNALPQTPNGKLDRQALPAPSQAMGQKHGAPLAEPKNPTEQLIAGIWKEVLKLNHLSTQDHFFDLGGHSLLAVQVLGKLRQATGQEISITDIFQFPTIASLALHLAHGEPKVSAVTQGLKRAQGRRLAWARAASPTLDAGV